MRFTKHFNLRQTRQSQAVPGAGQVRNNASGHVWATDRWTLLERLLVLGTEGGTYYVGENRLTKDNAQNLQELIADDGPRVVETVAQISRSGRAPKNDAAIFALAMSAAFGDEKTKQAAYAALPSVARTGTHLFQFAAESEALRGWGRGLRKAVGRWYTNRELDDLIYQLVKYRQRNGWTHADLLRLAHPKTEDEAQNAVFKWVVDGEITAPIDRLDAFAQLQSATTAEEAVNLITRFNLPREAVPTNLVNTPGVWEALLQKMPMTAMLRNLANMTRTGLLKPGSEATKLVCQRLLDEKRLKAARVHPLAILVAHATYEQGYGHKSTNQWTPVPEILTALDKAFVLAFQNVEPTGLRHLLGIDVSGSMGWGQLAGSPVTPAQAAAAMAMVAVETEPSVVPMAFASQFKSLPLRRGMSLSEVLKKTSEVNFGATDCALPMLWAKKERLPVDLFVVYTDNETWFGDIHPFQALDQYRNETGINAKLAVVGMVANNFTIADPRDPGMLDVVGFDTSVPNILREFGLA